MRKVHSSSGRISEPLYNRLSKAIEQLTLDPQCPLCHRLIFEPQTLENHNCAGDISKRIEEEVALARESRGGRPLSKTATERIAAAARAEIRDRATREEHYRLRAEAWAERKPYTTPTGETRNCNFCGPTETRRYRGFLYCGECGRYCGGNRPLGRSRREANAD